MKLPSVAAVALSALLSATTEARHAHVYTSAATSSSWTDSLSFSTFRSILAHRLGVAEYHTLDDTDDVSLRALNAFQPSQKALFAADDEPIPPELLIVLEDVDSVDVDSPGPTNFQMPSPPSAASNRQLLQDLGSQYEETHEVTSAAAKHCSQNVQQQVSSLKGTIDFDLTESNECLMVLHGRLSPDARKNGFGTGKDRVSGKDAARGVLHHFASLQKSEGLQFTLVLVEPESSGSLFKRSAPGSWGTYSRARRSAQKKAEPAPDDGQYHPGAKSSSTRSSSSSKSSASATSKSSASASATSTSKPSPPKGILPACFESKSACEDATHSCSGHGACALKYDLGKGKAKRQAEKAGARCWACACTVDVAKSASGSNRTTRWAGPACQKKDVSSSFWLIASATVLLVGVVGWAIGLLVSMGSEELPSVIGAGVAGPRAKS